MRKIVTLLPLILLLNACWFDTAPELYRVDVVFQENGKLTSGHSQAVCDFRGQTATRQCSVKLVIKDTHLNPSGAGQYKAKIDQMFADPAYAKSEYATAFSKHEEIALSLELSAHGRKENRYNLIVNGDLPWSWSNQATATNELGQKVVVVTDSELRDGRNLSFEPNPAPYIKLYNDAYNEFFNRKSGCYTGDVNGCKIIEFIGMQVTVPYQPANVTITWTPIDEDDLSHTDKVS
ncbi:hypothetical protein [Thalassospira profundimaris]|uniref:Lipoprotein n=1 Tax=Thalassospira profundimaris TaxID=502049 RepID=A0A367WP13_9PROT|nr:hypothetical protein [Thalassospira profundimaris]RCK43216.1 hypothetical protein TH30_19560 [Thalassospira profundimaris]